MSERITSLYILMPIELYGVPIPMERTKYTTQDADGNPITSHYSAKQIWPHARKSLDGKQVFVSFSPKNFEQELIELQKFPDRDKVKLLSWTEIRKLVQTPEWQTPDEME